MGLCVLWFYVQELTKAQPAVVLVLKRLRRRGNGLKSHLTDWEKPGIEPATPCLQDIGLSPRPGRLQISMSLRSTLLNVRTNFRLSVFYILNMIDQTFLKLSEFVLSIVVFLI